ncbi:MAG: acyl-CoA dehydrogenase N-terminal domain-containing protein, partial [Pseudomonadota bacterium]|nr:acyl-CoA dehydrogenase N-terminal domain-containing protein [Pseudomonadota bacterium]
MADYKAPLRDIDFVLNDFLNSEQHYAGLQGCEQLSSDLMDAI